MASAGQAHAHSSQPTHFSRPSGWRFSWCRPWKRGAVGRGFSGYSSVATLRNIVENDTPNPATGAKSSPRKPFSRSSFARWSPCSLRAPTSPEAPVWRVTSLPELSSAMGLLLDGRAGQARDRACRGHHGLGADPGVGLDESLAGQRRDRIAALERVDLLGWQLLLRLDSGGP